MVCKVRVCHCEQCKYVKNKRKNRRNKRIIKRIMNKKRRKSENDNKVISFYWA